jgi:hypothetical protein
VSSATVTLGDAANLVAVLGILAAPLIVYLRWLHRQIVALRTEVEAARRREAALAGAVARGFASTASVLAFEAGVIERVLTGRLEEVDSKETINVLNELRLSVNRAWAEASVLSGDQAARDSALRQIEARLGDEHSMRLAKLLNDL